MKAFTALVAVALSLSGALAQGPPVVNTPPSGTVCQPLLITWTGGTPPYFLSILPGNQPSAPAIVDFGEVGDVTSHRWVVNVPAGSEIGINLRDSTGTLSQSAPFPINPGVDTACLNGTTSSSSSSSTSSSTTTTRNTTSTTTTTTSTTTSPTTTTTTTSPTTTNTTPAPTNTDSDSEPVGDNAALGRFGQISVAGAVGAAIAAILL